MYSWDNAHVGLVGEISFNYEISCKLFHNYKRNKEIQVFVSTNLSYKNEIKNLK